MHAESELREVLARWQLDGLKPGRRPEVSALGNGHIHDTYLVETRSARYVLQRVNEQVFRDGDLVMAQTARVLDCWRTQDEYQIPDLIRARDGRDSIRVASQLWRLWRFIDGTRVVDPLDSLSQATQAGRAFGTFQRVLSTLPGPPLTATIPGFLDLNHYLDAFDAVMDTPRSTPAAEVSVLTEQCRLIEKHRGIGDRLSNRECLIHGDCKINNLLFDVSGSRVVAIIDFDTVMPGHPAWDFGDLVRSLCLSSGVFDVDVYAACLAGFGSQQEDVEIGDMVLAPMYLSLMLGIRFLTDHLSGDVYFKVNARGENLTRAERQFALFNSFLAGQDEMMRRAEASGMG